MNGPAYWADRTRRVLDASERVCHTLPPAYEVMRVH